MLPLDGITVISLEQAVAAPFATRHLAALGRVVNDLAFVAGVYLRAVPELGGRE